MPVIFVLLTIILSAWRTAQAQPSFYAFESGHVRPLALSPDGSRLYAVNTSDNRLDVFAVAPGGLTHLDAIPVDGVFDRDDIEAGTEGAKGYPRK